MYDEHGNVRHAPQWMNARNYSQCILPPDCPTAEYIATVFDVSPNSSQALAPPPQAFFPYQPHNLAQIGLRAQRRYRINSEQWRKRWAR